LVIVGDPCEPIFTPVVGTRPRLVVRKVIPGIAVIAVVFTDRAPLALTQIWTPFLPLGSGVPQSESFDTFLFINLHHRILPSRPLLPVSAVALSCLSSRIRGFPNTADLRRSSSIS